MSEPLRVISLFSGGGFADAALHAASEQTGIPVEVVMAVDSWPVAARVRDANLPGVRTTVADVKRMTRADLPPHELVIGGPPCQSHSTAGPKDCRCDVGGPASPRCCLADFLRLADGSAWLMENVRSRLINAPWSEQLCALHFNDVTTRKRWFYSNYLLHVQRTPGPRRFGHIRDHDADRLALLKGRSAQVGQVVPTSDDDSLGTLTAGKGGSSGFLRVTYDTGAAAGDADALASLTASAHLVIVDPRACVPEEGALPSLTSSSYRGSKNNGNGEATTGSKVKVGMRSYPQAYTEVLKDGVLGSVTSHTHDQPLRVGRARSGPLADGTRAVVEADVLGSLTAEAWHQPTPDGVRCPSLLEMARAHSIPDTWGWAGATKTQRGLLIANGWPKGMGTAVFAAMLRAVWASRMLAAAQ